MTCSFPCERSVIFMSFDLVMLCLKGFCSGFSHIFFFLHFLI